MAEALSKVSLCCNSGGNSIHEHRHQIAEVSGKSAVPSCAKGLPSLNVGPLALRSSSSSLSRSGFYGLRMGSGGQEGTPISSRRNTQPPAAAAVPSSNGQKSIGIAKSQRWWEKGLQPNMKEINDAQDLVDSLLNAGDKLVVVDFFSPGCGGCKALHPKISQLGEMNPDVQFLQVNYEEHKSMCYSLNVHVLPFFRFYRGADGRLCSFSCTNATIKKFKDALAKHSPDRCSLGPAKGLEEKELLALCANRDLSFKYTPKPEQREPVPPRQEILAEAAATPISNPNSDLPLPLPLPLPLSLMTSLKATDDIQEKTPVPSGR